MNKFLAIVLSTGVALATPVSSATLVDQLCDSLVTTAVNVMGLRQQGLPINMVQSIVPGDINGEVREMMMSMITAAFSFPIADSESGKQEMMTSFGEFSRGICYDSF